MKQNKYKIILVTKELKGIPSYQAIDIWTCKAVKSIAPMPVKWFIATEPQRTQNLRSNVIKPKFLRVGLISKA